MGDGPRSRGIAGSLKDHGPHLVEECGYAHGGDRSLQQVFAIGHAHFAGGQGEQAAFGVVDAPRASDQAVLVTLQRAPDRCHDVSIES